MKQSYKNVALFMALALTATPALAGTARGGSPLASTNDHAELATGASPTADNTTTVEAPLTNNVNIQPKVQADGTMVADPEANAKLRASTAIKSDKAPVAQTDSSSSVDNGGMPLAAGATRGAGGRVGLSSGAKDGSAK